MRVFLEVPVRSGLYDDVEISLLTLVNPLSLQPGRSGASDYSGTATLVDLGLKDSSGNPITSFTAVSETFNGTPGYLPTSVPEPNTLLSGLGLMTWLVIRRVKRV